LITYEQDPAAWSLEQAALLRAGRFDLADIENIAEEIEDVNASHQIELEHRMATLLAHLLKWQYQPERRGGSWSRTIKEQRKRVIRRLKKTPSLKPELADPEWVEGVWLDALVLAMKETDLDMFPEVCPWKLAEVLIDGWLPA
jgi:hypothetical protein